MPGSLLPIATNTTGRVAVRKAPVVVFVVCAYAATSWWRRRRPRPGLAHFGAPTALAAESPAPR
jgi:hypothetical protein